MRRVARPPLVNSALVALFVFSIGCESLETYTAVSQPRIDEFEHCAWTETEVEQSWERALEAAKASFETHKHKLKRTDLVTVINYDTLLYNPYVDPQDDDYLKPDRLRVYDASKSWTLVRSTWVSHAGKSGVLCATKFSNTRGTLISSRGAYRTHTKPWGGSKWGRPALNIDGLESGVNNRAYRRRIILHKAPPDGQGDLLKHSWGCFMTKPEVNAALVPEIAGGTLVYVYSSLPIADAEPEN